MTDEKKVNYVRMHVIGIETINPYSDHRRVDEVTKVLHDAEFFKTPLNQLRKESIINIILAAQNKKPRKHIVVRKQGVMR